MTAPRPTVRQRARAAMIEEIVASARRQLAEVGAARLSLRAVTRDLGMVSSALYRYFPTRDDLLTELIVRGYDELGAAVERADHDAGGGPRERLHAACAAMRGWALADPHMWGLLYGTPVPGYRAPERTKGPATRVPSVLVAIMREPGPGVIARPASRGIDPGAIASARAFVGPGPSDTQLTIGLMVWTWAIGTISTDLWGHLVGSVDDREEFFRAGLDYLADDLGIP